MILTDQAAYCTVLRQHAARYPEMQPQDAVKLAYQGAFGGGHLIAEEGGSLALLRQERSQAAVDNALAPFSLIGAGRARMELGSGALLGLSSPLLNRMFVLSSNRPAGGIALFETLLRLLADVVSEGVFSFEQTALMAYLSQYRAKGCPPVHHSACYRDAYHPCYRVVEDCYAALLPWILILARGDSKSLPPFPRGRTGERVKARLMELFPEARF